MAKFGSISLLGDLHLFPFISEPLGEATKDLFASVAENHGIGNVLVLKRFPTGIASITDAYLEAVEGVEQPEVLGLARHASQVLETLDNPPRRIGQQEQNLLLSQFIADWEWKHPYLQRAARQESFEFDVARFVAEATWQGSTVETDDQILAELAALKTAYHEWLDKVDTLDLAAVGSYAAAALQEDTIRARVQDSFDAVLALEFEEFTAIDREYLAALTKGCDLVCVAEADSAIQRTWNEPGRIESQAPLLDVSTHTAETLSNSQGRIPHFLATGETPKREEAVRTDEVAIIEADTFETQLATIADEIERLHRTDGVAYDDMGVVMRDSNAPIAETVRSLRAAGIPVASATTSGFEHAPAARELYAVASWCSQNGADGPSNSTTGHAASSVPGWETDRAEAVLNARLDGDIQPHLESISGIPEGACVRAAVDRWLAVSGMKARIAANEDPLEARVQFDYVATARELARTIDRSDELCSTWKTFCDGLERAMTNATSDKLATELDLPDGGVLVDAARVVKNEDLDVVFLVDVIDSEYPASPQFNSLFPTPHLESLPEYPAFTAPTSTDVTETYSFQTAATDRPLHAYYAALSRRMLAVGARAASDRLYFGTFREEAGETGSKHRPSRFLAAIEDAFGELDRVEHDEIHSHGQLVKQALASVDNAVERVHRGGLVHGPIDLAEVEAEFATIQQVLDADPPSPLRTAIETRIDFADGRVRRE